MSIFGCLRWSTLVASLPSRGRAFAGRSGTSKRLGVMATVAVVIGGGFMTLGVAQASAAGTGGDLTGTVSTCAPSATPAATADTSLDNVFAGQLGPGWIGGDMAYSTQLPNGQEAFAFNDTLIGTAQSDGQVTHLQGFVHNSELVGNLSSLQSNYAGTYTAPQTLIPDTNTTGGYSYLWEVGSSDVENGEQLVFVNEYKVVSAGVDTFSGRSAIAVFTLPPTGLPIFQSLVNDSTVATHMWGNGMTTDGTYNYIYGTNWNHVVNQGWMDVARVPLNHTATVSDWQYWNGTTWVSGEANAVVTGNSNLFSGVTHEQGGTGYEEVNLAGTSSPPSTIAVSYSCSPEGPWSPQVPVYTIPEIAQYSPDEFAYTPNFHPELSATGGLVISYSLNSTVWADLLNNVHQYQPRFVQLDNASYTVTFNANGGTGTMAAETHNVPTALTANAFTRTGYIFTGWNTVAGGTGTSYANGATYPFTASVTLYAQWAVAYTVTFNANGGAAVASLSGPDGSSITLPSDTHAGYTFDGWFTAASGGTEVGGAGSSYTIPAGGITLYAQWTAVPVPTVSAVSPNSGPLTGGTAITITGTGFVTGATVVIGQGNGAGSGAIAATKVVVVSSTKITAVTSGGAKSGTWTLFVITSGGTSAANSGAYFTYH